MSSLAKTPYGFTLRIKTMDGRTRWMRLGYLTRQQANTVRERVERMNVTQIAGLPYDADTLNWLAKMGDKLHERIAATGLTERRTSSLLGDYLEAYQKEHVKRVSRKTSMGLATAAENLLDYFGADKRVQEILPDHARQWREWMLALPLAENTVRRRTGRAHQMFAPAVKLRRIAENPFDGLPNVIIGGLNEHFVPLQVVETFLQACPDPYARLYFALARFGGLRCPSEVNTLYWSQVKWQDGRILIRSPKTSRFDGKSERYIPLFKLLEPQLLECFALAPEGDSLVIPKTPNIEKMKKILKKSGISVWEDFFRTLRRSREQELKASHPEYIVAAIMGHSIATSRKYYGGIRPEDFNACVND